jgi:hypothetical protein
MSDEYPDWSTLYSPEDHIGEATAAELCVWLHDKLEEYAGMTTGVTYDLCLEATQMLEQWLEQGRQAHAGHRGV